MHIMWMQNRKIWLYHQAIDFRKQLNSLIYLVNTELNAKPINGDIYLFVNRDYRKMKLLFWDRNGFVMGYKRLETGRFDWYRNDRGAIELDWEELYLLISGLPFRSFKRILPKNIEYYQ